MEALLLDKSVGEMQLEFGFHNAIEEMHTNFQNVQAPIFMCLPAS
jgi:hypothetical protein